MSVKQWKRVITITVILIIITLLVLSIFFIARVVKYHNMVESGKWTNLSEYGEMDATELSGLFHYLSTAKAHDNLEYQKLYPNLYVDNDFTFVPTEGKVCYLTFDDAPDTYSTERILNILKEFKIKATFFVVYDDSPEAIALYKRIIDEGHTIGIHSTSHDYEQVYSSVEAFLSDMDQVASLVETATGQKPEIFRFLGGSINMYNANVYRDLISEVLRRGYMYYDWNVSAGDTAYSQNAAEVLTNIQLESAGQDKVIVQLNDGAEHNSTIEALPKVIEHFKRNGYSFSNLNKTVTPCSFGY